MAYVLDYTVIAAGAEPAVVRGTSHDEALRAFVANPRFRLTNHKGTYDAADGEIITVVGYLQEEWTTRHYAERRLQSAREEQPKGGKNAVTREMIASRIERAQAALNDLEPLKQRVLTFRVRHETVHMLEYINKLGNVVEEPEEAMA